MKFFFTTYVRPLLEYNSVVWSPTNQRDIKILENVQRFYTNKIQGCVFRPYYQRLAILNLQSLQFRRTIADLLFLYSLVSGEYNISLSPFLVYILPSITRSHNLRIIPPFLNHSSYKKISYPVPSRFGIPFQFRLFW